MPLAPPVTGASGTRSTDARAELRQPGCKHTCIHTSMAPSTRLPRTARRAQLIEAAARRLPRARLRRHLDGRRRPGGRRQPAHRVPHLRVQGGPLPRRAATVLRDARRRVRRARRRERAPRRGAATADAARRPGPPRRLPAAVARTPGTSPLFADLAVEFRSYVDGLRPGDPRQLHRRRRAAARLGGAQRRRPPRRRASATGSTSAIPTATTSSAS